MNQLKKSYEAACESYLKEFCSRHDYGYDPDSWVGSDAGTIACVSDLFVDMVTIRTDVDRDAPECEFIKWYDYCLRLGMLNAKSPNYDSWLRKCPIRSEDDILDMEKRREYIEGLEKELKKMCEQ